MATCSVPICDRQAVAKGFCGGHYQRFKFGGSLETPLRAKTRRHTETRHCEECGEPFEWYLGNNNAGRFCSRTCFVNRRGEKHHAWRGGHIGKDGHVYIWTTRVDGRRKLMARARVTMEEHLGRELEPGETVHHKDVNAPTNDDLDNLQLRKGRHGRGAAYRCGDCGSHNIITVDLEGGSDAA